MATYKVKKACEVFKGNPWKEGAVIVLDEKLGDRFKDELELVKTAEPKAEPPKEIAKPANPTTPVTPSAEPATAPTTAAK